MKNLLPVGYAHTGCQKESVPEQAEICHSIGEFMFFTYFLGGRGATAPPRREIWTFTPYPT